MDNQYAKLIQERADLKAAMQARLEAGPLDAEAQAADDADFTRVQTINAEIERHERVQAIENAAPARPVHAAAPPVIGGRGDNFGQAFQAWMQHGDTQALAGAGEFASDGGFTLYAASNAVDLGITTAASAGHLVPTGFYNQIQARKNELALYKKLPIRNVPGTGTTVEVPYENAEANEFVSTAETVAYDKDTPLVAKHTLTLVKYTKQMLVSEELLQDTPTNLMAFVADYVGRGMAQTHNKLLLTAVGAQGTKFADWGVSSIVFGDPEKVLGNVHLSNYLDQDGVAAWVMRSATHWAINSIVGNDRQYSANVDGMRSVLGYPVLYSQHAAAVGASAKSVFFGNWNEVGMREAPALTFMRNPYRLAHLGQIELLWSFRTVYRVLQPLAIGYAQHGAGGG
jgi:HK97 family phage major capsid protein